MIKQMELLDNMEVSKIEQSEITFAPVNNSIINRWLKFAAVSEKSIATYKGCLKQLFLYFADNDISEPTRENLENWRDSLINNGKAASTVCLYLTATKLFFRWLAQENIFPNIADHLKNRVKVDISNHKKDALSIQQAKDLQKVVKGKDLQSLRNFAIVSLMLATGIRSIEVVRANICDIRQVEGQNFLYVQGKGRSEKAECVLVADKVHKAIQDYLKAREKAAGKKLGKNSPLFVSISHRNKNSRLDTQTIRKMIKINLRKIGIDTPTITCHSLRHTCATVMIMKKQELYNVQMVLRHKNLATTMIYNNFVNRMKNRAEIVAANVLLI